jgi:hypothetical protein
MARSISSILGMNLETLTRNRVANEEITVLLRAQFLQSKTQSTGSIASVIAATSLPKGEVYEKIQSDFADLRKP